MEPHISKRFNTLIGYKAKKKETFLSFCKVPHSAIGTGDSKTNWTKSWTSNGPQRVGNSDKQTVAR